MQPYFFNGLAGINHAEALRFRLCQVKERLSRTILEIVSRGFHTIFIMLQARMRLRRVKIQQIRTIRQQTARRPHAQVADFISSQFATARLICKGRIKIPIGNYHGASFQRRTNHLGNMLGTVSGEQQRLRTRSDIRIGTLNPAKQQLANGHAKHGAARFARDHAFAPLRLNVRAQPFNLRGFADAVYTFKGDEYALHIHHSTLRRSQRYRCSLLRTVHRTVHHRAGTTAGRV